jgi:hypothetical protein
MVKVIISKLKWSLKIFFYYAPPLCNFESHISVILNITFKYDNRADETVAVFNPSRQIDKEGENTVFLKDYSTKCFDLKCFTGTVTVLYYGKVKSGFFIGH